MHETPYRNRPSFPVRGALLAAIAGLALLAGCGDADVGASPRAGVRTLQHVNDTSQPAHDVASGGHENAAAGAHDAHPRALEGDEPLPGASLYHLAGTWTDHRGEDLVLGDLQGHPVIVVMIYASCETACPILVRDALRIDAALPDDVRDDTRVLVVSFDTEHDAPERLAAYVTENDLDDRRWRFAVGDAHATRALAALLGVRYRPAGDGMFSHTNLITVLGPDGVVLQRSEGLGVPSGAATEAIVRAAAAR